MSHIHSTHIRTRYALNSALALIACLAFFHSAHAADLFWDANGTTAGFGTTPGGTWGVSAFWSTNSAGTSVTANTTTTVNDNVNFGSDTSGFSTAGNVSVSLTKSVGNITFGAGNTADLTIQGGTGLILGSSSTITNNSNSILGIRTVLTGTNGFTKAGAGTMLSTNTVHTYTGGTVVSEGVLSLFGTSSINSSASLTVASGATFTNNSSVGFNKALIVTEGALFTGTTKAFTPTSLTISGDLVDGFSSLNFVSSLTKAGLLTVNLSNTAVGTYSLISSVTTGSFSSVTISGTALASADGNTTFTGSDGVFNYTLNNVGNSLQVSAFSSVPEPSTYTMLAGLGILGFAVYRRRTSRV